MRLLTSKILPLGCLAIGLLLSACAGPIGVGMGFGTDALGMYATKRDDLPPADTADQIAPHENWCYETMGYAECYTCPQDVHPDRLINVDPENRYPLTVRAYNEAVAQSK